MQYHTADISLKDFFQALPLIVIAVFWCEKSSYSIKQFEPNLKNTELFKRDLFILTFSFLLASLISLIFAFDNSDAKGWWVVIIYFITLYGLLFSLVFSFIALLIKNHKVYTFIFSFLIIVLVSLGDFFPQNITFLLIGSTDTFFILRGSLLLIHCLFAIIYKIFQLVQWIINSQGSI